MSCVDTDTILSLAQAAGDDAENKLAHVASCPACRSTLTELATLTQVVAPTHPLSAELTDRLYQEVAVGETGVEMSEVDTSWWLAIATFLVSTVTVLSVGLFPLFLPRLLYGWRTLDLNPTRLALALAIGLFAAASPKLLAHRQSLR
jgi:hypothetical protein